MATPCVSIWTRIALIAVCAALADLVSHQPAAAQMGVMCRPVAERTREQGCWIIGQQNIGRLSHRTAYWRIDSYPSRTEAEANKTPRSAILESFGKVWLLTIDERRRSSGRAHVAEIGPLPIEPGDFAVQYMEAVFDPGMTTITHRHSGPEAWYTLQGEMCLETPAGKQLGRAGGPPVIVEGGAPMHLTAVGTEQRRALVLILHRAGEPPTTPTRDWTPKGLCKLSDR